MLVAMPRLHRLPARELIGEISQDQLEQLIDLLEEEDENDRDYYIDRDTIDMLREANMDADLVALLERALGDAEEMDIVWVE
jgi:hypothetical protein